MSSDQEMGNSNKTLYVDISNLNFSNLKRISSQLDIDKIQCNGIDPSPIYDIDASHKIVAIGDIHGDLTSLLVILFGAQLINNNLEWAGGNTFLVFTGDLLDNYRDETCIDSIKQHPADEITIISFLADLNHQALQTQGRVLLCLGNHELLNIVDKYYAYVSEPTQDYFRQHLYSREKQFKANSILRHKLSCLFEPFILINNKYFFCHAGLTKEFILDLKTNYPDISMRDKLIEFSRDIKNIVQGIDNPSKTWIIKKHIKNDKNDSLFWTRQYRTKNEGCDIFTEVAELLEIKNLILIKGHDSQSDHIIKESCDKNIYLIDTEISRSFLDNKETNQEKLISDNMNYLEIKNDIFSIISVKLTNPEIIYKEKIEEFNFYNKPASKSLISKVKDKTGMIVTGVTNALYNALPANPFKRNPLHYEVEHEDGTTYYDENDVPHDASGRVLFGGLYK